MSSRYPAIFRLQIHEEDGHTVFFEEGNEVEALAKNLLKRTTLTAYFEKVQEKLALPPSEQFLGKNDAGQVYPAAPELTYQEFPTFYTWDRNKWKRRVSPHKSDMIGRIYHVHPNAGEKFYLRMLLCKIKGATSFAELHSHFSTYKEACVDIGLLADDKEWEECLREAATFLMPNQLRELFVYILFHNKPSSPLLLWNLSIDGTHSFKDHLSEDYRDFENSTDRCLYSIEDAIVSISNGAASLADYGLPSPSIPRQHVNRALQHELNYDPNVEDLKWKRSYE